jgi:hypothetical protein
MKSMTVFRVVVWGISLALLTLATAGRAQGTACTYQGQLLNAGNPANGNYDLSFALYTNSSGGLSSAGPVVTNAVPVSNGLFTVSLDFGPGVNARAVNGYYLWSGIDGSGNVSVGAELPAGSGSWTVLSDRNVKENFRPVNAQAVLAKVAALPMNSWNYKTQDKSIRHIGPVAQDFHAAFGYGEDERHIAEVDEGGVALAAIQGLNSKMDDKDAKLEALAAEVQADRTENAQLRAELDTIKALLAKVR